MSRDRVNPVPRRLVRVTLILALLMAGCGGDDDSTAQDEESEDVSEQEPGAGFQLGKQIGETVFGCPINEVKNAEYATFLHPFCTDGGIITHYCEVEADDILVPPEEELSAARATRSYRIKPLGYAVVRREEADATIHLLCPDASKVVFTLHERDAFTEAGDEDDLPIGQRTDAASASAPAPNSQSLLGPLSDGEIEEVRKRLAGQMTSVGLEVTECSPWVKAQGDPAMLKTALCRFTRPNGLVEATHSAYGETRIRSSRLGDHPNINVSQVPPVWPPIGMGP